MKNLQILVLLFFCQITWSQANDYKITYQKFHGNLKTNAVLYVKENQPTVMQTIMASTVQVKAEKDTTYVNESNVAQKVEIIPINYSKFPDEYLKVNHLNNKIEILKVVLKKKYVITDELNYSWQITNETKKIKNYTCYKATTTFRGNNFVVWFTPEIPINAGPWKWYGLPGLIVEATDADKNEVYLLEKVEKLTEEIPFPSSNSETISLKKFDDMANEAWESFNAINNDRNIIEVSTKTKRVGLEKVYEWEIQPAK